MRHYILSLIILLFATSILSAETINPNSLLDSSPPILTTPEAEQSKEDNKVEEGTAEEELPWDDQGWTIHTRALQCHSMGNVRAYTMARGQQIVMSGFKNPGYVPNDPFDGLILTRNPLTGEYTVLMVQVSTGLTCIVQMGTSLQTTEDVINKLQKEQEELESDKK